MKKLTALLLGCILLCGMAGFSGCSRKEETEYGEKEMITPFWKSDVMYNESVLLLSREGGAASGNLAFVPTGKVKITNPTMDVTYEEGKDYTVSGRTITATADTRMPTLEEKVLYGIDMPSGAGLSTQPASQAGKDKGYDTVLYTETAFLIERQILVTYPYDKTQWDTSVIPVYQGDKLPNTVQKLQAGQSIDIVAFGDSISTGCNSTGGGLQTAYFEPNAQYTPFDRAPYTPTFPELFAKGLQNRYGVETTLFGAAVGGTTSEWGANVAGVRVVNPDIGYTPDLVTITFGMNDATLNVSLEAFEKNMNKIVTDIRASSEKPVEIILLGTMLANPDAVQCKNQPDYFPVLQRVADAHEGVAAVDVGAMHAFLLQNKAYADMIANNVNHPNDFLIRVYAMHLLATLIAY